MDELGGGAELRFPGLQRGETIEREGQRVMAVRGWSDGLSQTALLEEQVGVWRAFGRGRPTRARSGKGFVCGLTCIGIWNSGSNSEPQRRSLLSVLPACQAQSGRRRGRRTRNQSASYSSGSYSLELDPVTFYCGEL